jgi:hypothetical protein
MINRYWFIFIIVGFLFLINSFCFSSLKIDDKNPIYVQTSVSTNTITIGDKFIYKVKIFYSPDILISNIPITDTLNVFEIKDYNIKDARQIGLFSKKMLKEYSYLLSTFTIGEYTVPGFVLSFTDKNQKTRFVKTKDIRINVISVKHKKGDKDDIRDIEPFIRAKYSLLYYLIFFIIILGIVLGPIIYYLYIIQKLPDFISKKQKIEEPAHVVALRELDKLKNSDLIDKGDYKLFYIILSEILKTYLEKRYDINVLDKTTYEVYYTLREKNIDKKMIGKIKEFLENCDLVKFAKYVPPMKDVEKDLICGYEIIEATKPILEDNVVEFLRHA